MARLTHDGFRVTQIPAFAPKGFKTLSPIQTFADSYAGSGVRLREHPSFLKQRPIEQFAENPGRCRGCGSDSTLCIYFSHATGAGYDAYAFYELECQECGCFTCHGYSTDGCSGY